MDFESRKEMFKVDYCMDFTFNPSLYTFELSITFAQSQNVFDFTLQLFLIHELIMRLKVIFIWCDVDCMFNFFLLRRWMHWICIIICIIFLFQDKIWIGNWGSNFLENLWRKMSLVSKLSLGGFINLEFGMIW
jgi:hypothetical protein